MAITGTFQFSAVPGICGVGGIFVLEWLVEGDFNLARAIGGNGRVGVDFEGRLPGSAKRFAVECEKYILVLIYATANGISFRPRFTVGVSYRAVVEHLSVCAELAVSLTRMESN